MKKIFCILLIFSMLFINCASCKMLQDKEYCPYGILNKEERSEDVEYQVKKSSVIISIAGIGTIFLPIIFTGFKLYEPKNIKE